MKVGSISLMTWMAVTVAAAIPAAAHIKVVMPNERPGRGNMGDPQKVPPCGVSNETRSHVVTAFKPGQDIRVGWTETIYHPGYFRVALDLNGHDDFTPPSQADWQLFRDYSMGAKQASDLPTPITTPTVRGDMTLLLDYAGVHTSRVNNGNWEFTVKLPDTPCNDCTLQIIQIMVDKPNYNLTNGNTFYYHCADIKIEAADEPNTGGNGGAPAIDEIGGNGGQAVQGGMAGHAGEVGGEAGGGQGGFGGQGGDASDGDDENDGDGEDTDRAGRDRRRGAGCSIGGGHQPTSPVFFWLLIAVVARLRRV